MVLLVLWLPFIRCQFHWPGLRDWSLYGVGYTVQQPKPSLASISSMSYQNDIDVHAKEHIGYRDFLIRLDNQLDYWLFGLLRSNIIKAKKGNLIGGDYMEDYLGKNSLKESQWIEKTSKLRRFQDTLAARHINVLYCIAPGKASFAADKIPDQYLTQLQPVNNYKMMKEQLMLHGCNTINFHAWFDDLKQHPSGCKLYPDIGAHWSVYGASLALDSLLRYMSASKGVTLRAFVKTMGRRQVPDKWLDTDLRDMTNLLCEFPVDSVSYPHYAFSNADSASADRPRITVISDSYMVSMEYCTDLYQFFDSRSRVWDYCTHENYLSGAGTGRAINIADIDSSDFVIIMATERNYDKFDFGLIDTYFRSKSATR